jgi:hypothetical protein
MHRLLLRLFAVPVARPAIRLGNVRSYFHFGKSSLLARWTTFMLQAQPVRLIFPW